MADEQKEKCKMCGRALVHEGMCLWCGHMQDKSEPEPAEEDAVTDSDAVSDTLGSALVTGTAWPFFGRWRSKSTT